MESNQNFKKDASKGISRRRFLGNSALFMSGAVLSPFAVHAHKRLGLTDTLRIALIGSGSRGTGAALNALRADENVELVAIADVFRDMVDRSYDHLSANEHIKNQVNVPEQNKLVGLEAYKEAIDLADVVILATPPAFRPLHFETAVRAGKHVFMEKPLSTDAPGGRRILAAGKEAESKGLSVVVGLQNRYALRHQAFKEQIEAGVIGDITSMTCNYMIGGLQQADRQPGQTEMEYQLRNWRYFEWLWGGSPAGLTIHYEDLVHMIKGSYPVRAFGTGGKAEMRSAGSGDIFDHYYIEYEYADGSRFHSRTRHINGCWMDRSISIQGTGGSGNIAAWRDSEIIGLDNQVIWHYDDTNDPNPFQTEHDLFFESIRSGKPMNDTEWAGMSNMTSIMGRMAVQSGQQIEWDQAFNSDLVLVPDHLTFDSDPHAMPDENGHYHVITPGSDRSRVL